MGEVIGSVGAVLSIAALIPGPQQPFLIAASIGLNLLGGLLFAPKPPKAPKIDLPSTARDRIQNIRSSTDSHVVVYGTARVAARPYVFAESSGSDSRYLHLIAPLAGHEVDDVTHLILDDETLEWGVDINASTGDVAQTDPPDGRFNASGRVRVFKHLGASDQSADGTAVAELANWSNDHRGRGIAYLYLRYRYFQKTFQNGAPQVSAIVRGRKVWDPRDSSQDQSDPATWAFSNNWALCVLDYLMNGAFGLGARLDEVDIDSFVAAANISDELVETGPTESPPGSPDALQARYTCDGVIDTADDPLGIMEGLLSAGAGALSYSQGKYFLFAGAFVTPSVTLTAADLAGDIEVQPRKARAQLFNAVRGTFVDPEENYQPTDFPPRTNALYETQDGGVQIFRDIELPFTQDSVRAQRIAEIVLRKSRQGITVKFPAKLGALKLAVFDTVNLTLDEPGANFGWSGKAFRVLAMEFSEKLQDGVLLTLQEDDASSYEWDGGTALTYDPAPDTTLPDPFSIPAPQNVIFASGDAQLFVAGDGTVRPRIKVTWDVVDNVFVTQGGQVEIQYRDAALGGSPLDWSDGNTQVKIVGGHLTVAYLTDVEDGATYDIRARSITAIGSVSDDNDGDWAQSFQHLVVGKTAPPEPPDTLLVSRLADGTRRFRWTHASPPLDLAGYLIRYATSTTDWDAMTPLNNAGVITASPFETNELAAGTYNFAIRSIDTSGNVSESSTLATGVVLGDPRLKSIILQRLEHDLGWPGTITNGFVDGDGALRSTTVGGWDGLPAASPSQWDDLPDSWDEILPSQGPLIYETPEIDVGATLSFTPLLTPTSNVAVTIEMRSGGDGSPQIDTAYGPIATVSGARYVQFRITVNEGVSPQEPVELSALTIFLDGEIVTESFEDVDTSGADSETFERLAAGHFRIAPSGAISSIVRAEITALQNVGPGWTWELISKQALAFASPGQLAAEFKVYNGSGVLADCVIDAEIKGPASA